MRAEFRADVDQSERLRADGYADDQENRDVRDFDFLREEAAEGADRQNESAGNQRVLRDFHGDGRFQVVLRPMSAWRLADLRITFNLRGAAQSSR